MSSVTVTATVDFSQFRVLVRNLGFLGFPKYEVDSNGAVWSLNKKTRRPLKLWKNRGGYLTVTLKDSGRRKGFLVNRLVLLALVGYPPPGREVTRHLNRTPADNRLENLAWGSDKDNADDKATHGTLLCGEGVGNSKLTEADVVAIRSAYLAGESQRSIATRLGTTQTNISMVVCRRTWKHLDGGKETTHTRTTFTSDDLQSIQSAVAAGESQNSVARRFGVGSGTICRILQRLRKKSSA